MPNYDLHQIKYPKRLCGDKDRRRAGGHFYWIIVVCSLIEFTISGDPAEKILGPGGDPRVCGAVYVGEYREEDHGCVRPDVGWG